MADSSLRRQALYYLTGALFALTVPVTYAAGGLIESSRVTVAPAGDNSVADLGIRFNCKVEYLRHEPQGSGDSLRIYLDPTGICNGVSPLVAQAQGRYRPINADSARLVDLEYDGTSASGPVLTLNFSERVKFNVSASAVSFELTVHVIPLAADAGAHKAVADHPTRRIMRPEPETPDYAINLVSYRRVPTVADVPRLQLNADQRIYYSEADVDGTTWYRLRLGNFDTANDAANALAGLKGNYPGSWISQVSTDAAEVVLAAAGQETVTVELGSALGDEPITETAASLTTDLAAGGTKVDRLMEDARRSMVVGETSRAIQIYTKVLQLPENARQPQAQEYLALAREKNGQTAHAKAEYERYLSLYGDSEGAVRVSQRLAALLATDRQIVAGNSAPVGTANARRTQASDWRVQTFFTQYYRRDANQQNNEEEIVSQSALYSDVSIDARRRGERFDFTSRVSAGYRKELLDDDEGSGDSWRVSYAYADLTDAATGLRGRVGRQSAHSGGVLGRFDGLTFGYQLNERVRLNSVVGTPAYSNSNDLEPDRLFYGASVNYGPVLENLDLGVFYIEQTIEGIQDRQAVGGEFRYFGANQSYWGMIDYDISYNEVASAFLQGTWRFASRLSIHANADRRSSPFLSTGNALIGQPGFTFDQLIEIFGEDELRQMARDRSASSTTYTVGVSYPLTPTLQINADASHSELDGTPASGGIFGTDDSSYSYYSTSLIASSFLREGDVNILTTRYSESDTSEVISMALDSRYPIGRRWRINPRFRVDRRRNLRNSTDEWLFTPGLRLYYRRSQKLRVQLEVGKQFSQRENLGVDLDLDRESYFINIGYQAFF